LCIVFEIHYGFGKNGLRHEEIEDEVYEEKRDKKSSKKYKPQSSSTYEPFRVETSLKK